ncbi:ATP-binding protein [Streptomyces sp. NBC_01497]|uniref:ATP-binding protein n=1 Tax=Streptomyces sp. NBC_01497 TaxID=2903885 RepID=UPI002E314BD0|nr:ATP-binding protein [Streptomyces sp. NBC_01497]
METVSHNEGEPLVDRPLLASLVLEDSAEIAQARETARDFLTIVQTEHGLPVSQRAMDTVQLVVSELVTNARRYAPGPCLMEHGLEIVMAVCQTFRIRREPVGKRITAAIRLADDPGGHAAGRQTLCPRASVLHSVVPAPRRWSRRQRRP